jgi:S-DNA-T family DNA segregation ATPase FtsK/SpoIIIE
MAYQTRQRDPFLDQETHALLVRRGQEMLGLALLGVGLALAALMLSYTPDDPNWMAATDTAPENLLGRTGASVAAILMMIVGYGALVLPIASIVWGVRFLLHAGADRALPRVFFLPIVLALASIYSASHVPPSEWTHSFGLGGLFGDTVLGAVLNALPVSAQLGLKVVAAAAFLGGAAMLFHVAGISSGEFRAAMRFLVYGLLASIAMVISVFRGVGSGAGRIAGRAYAAQVARRDARAEARAMDVASGDEADVVAYLDEDENDPDQAPRRQGFFNRIYALGRREDGDELIRVDDLEPELPRRAAAFEDDDIEAPDDDRVRARISDAIRSRVRRPNPIAAAAQRRMASGDSQSMDRLHLSPALRAEPPLTASHATQDDEQDENIFAEDGVDFDEGYEAPPYAPASDAQKRRVVQHVARKAPAPSRRAMADAQPSLPLQAEAEAYEFPPLTLLTSPETIERHHLSDTALEENARMLESVLDDYGVKGEIVSVRPGPVVTMYELEPAPGLKASPRHRLGRRHRAVDVGPVGAGLDRAGPLGDRDRACPTSTAKRSSCARS